MAGMRLPPIISACPWVGDKDSVCPLPTGKVLDVWYRSPSHFETPKGVSIWLATFVRCLWHPLCKQPNYIFSLVTAPCLLPLASSLLTAQRHPLCQLPLSDASGILFANDLTASFPCKPPSAYRHLLCWGAIKKERALRRWKRSLFMQ